MQIAARLVGVFVIGIGVAFAYMGWESRDQVIPPSLCGCEFDAAHRRSALVFSLLAAASAILALISGLLLLFRHRLDTPGLALWLIFVAGIPWIQRLFPPPLDPTNLYTTNMDTEAIIFSGSLAGLGAALLASYFYRRNVSRRLTCV